MHDKNDLVIFLVDIVKGGILYRNAVIDQSKSEVELTQLSKVPRDCFGTRMAIVQPILGMASGTATFKAQPNSFFPLPTFHASTVSNVVQLGAGQSFGTFHVSFGSS